MMRIPQAYFLTTTKTSRAERNKKIVPADGQALPLLRQESLFPQNLETKPGHPKELGSKANPTSLVFSFFTDFVVVDGVRFYSKKSLKLLLCDVVK
jgi:hypothetical protein